MKSEDEAIDKLQKQVSTLPKKVVRQEVPLEEVVRAQLDWVQNDIYHNGLRYTLRKSQKLRRLGDAKEFR